MWKFFCMFCEAHERVPGPWLYSHMSAVWTELRQHNDEREANSINCSDWESSWYPSFPLVSRRLSISLRYVEIERSDWEVAIGRINAAIKHVILISPRELTNFLGCPSSVSSSDFAIFDGALREWTHPFCSFLWSLSRHLWRHSSEGVRIFYVLATTLSEGTVSNDFISCSLCGLCHCI